MYYVIYKAEIASYVITKNFSFCQKYAILNALPDAPNSTWYCCLYVAAN